MSEENKVELAEANQEGVMSAVLPSADAPVITSKKLLEVGAYFGHQTRLWNPKMKPYIFGERNGVHIIDLDKTIVKIEEAYAALKDIVTRGGKVLFVGTRKQHAEIIKAEAERSGSFYINNRWLGGTLTNFRTIATRIRYFRELEMQDADGTLDKYSKKEASDLRKLKDKLALNFDGIKEMRRVPDAVFVVSPLNEKNAVLEAKKLGIPVFGLVDTNGDPDSVDYMIPCNDDATKTVHLMLQVIADAIVEAKGGITVVARVADDSPATENIDEALKRTAQEAKEANEERKDRRPRKARTEHSDKPSPAKREEK
jgi:small subunit ribosomal protein S2